MNHPESCLLQVAVDTRDIPSAQSIADQIYPHFDILEIGTPLIIEEGLRALEVIKSSYPDKLYLADLKIMDAGKIEAESAFKRGADIVTVLALADNRTIRQALEVARRFGGQLMADLINTPQPEQRARELAQLGVDIICVHTPHDKAVANYNPMAELSRVRATVRCRLAVAGGLKLDSAKLAAMSGADVVVIGGAIVSNPSPGDMAARIRQQIRENYRCQTSNRSS